MSVTEDRGPIRCTHCGTESPADSRFCRSCASPFGAVSALSTAVAAGVDRGHVRRLVSSDSVPAGGFTPGTILLNRYRIIGLLGRGGMGEVYRADDLKLGQAVALKFLPAALADDPVRRERFLAEVRITRQVSHPNICRVYDIGELEEPTTEGRQARRYFLTMEYIDGEDLASLIQRIGYLSNEKALELTRQLVVGLAAAHERGVLHRDLKPANVMVDGRGRVRITDFGLAIAVEDSAAQTELAGTPAYMAPEQLAGQGASVRSDIYSLGLIVYELYTGRRAFTARTLPELREQKETSVPSAPSDVRLGVDPTVERAIMRCLERDPRQRPASIRQLAAMLPGNDPLAAMIAAGETPSPELVAASGGVEGLSTRAAVLLFTATVAGVVAGIALNSYSPAPRLVASTKSPEALAERARIILADIGYNLPPRDEASGFENTPVPASALTMSQRQHVQTAFSPRMFWYRRSPQPLVRRESIRGNEPIPTVNADDPPLSVAGEAIVYLTPAGDLRGFEAVPDSGSTASASGPNWNALFTHARLTPSAWTQTSATQTPPFFADTRTAWLGALPAAPDLPVRIEAAEYQGHPIQFQIVTPWTPSPRSAAASSGAARTGTLGALVIGLLAGVGSCFLAYRNVRTGRGDRRGAARLVAFTVAIWTAAWIVMEHHVTTISEFYLLWLFLSVAVLVAALTWVSYLALEPFVRRRWPNVLVTWTRVLGGDWRDPLVGRDLAIGCAAGVWISVLVRIVLDVPRWSGYTQATPQNDPALLSLDTGRGMVAALIEGPSGSVGAGLLTLALLCVIAIVSRRRWLAATVVAILVGFTYPLQPDVPVVFNALIVFLGAPLIWLMMRSGLLAAVTAMFVYATLLRFPLTASIPAWYGWFGVVALVVVLTLMLYGLRTTLAGVRVFELSDV